MYTPIQTNKSGPRGFALNLIRNLRSQGLLCHLNIDAISSPYLREQFKAAIERLRAEEAEARDTDDSGQPLS